MRSPFRSLLSALSPAKAPAFAIPVLAAIAFAALAGAASAQAQEHGKAPPKAAAPAKPGAKQGKEKVMAGSPMTKVRFSEPAYPLADDGTYRAFMDKILEEYGRRCVRQEQFGWELAKGDQERLDYVFQGTMANYGNTGYLLGEIHPKTVTDPETLVFLADREKTRYLMVWTPLEASVLFMMCETASSSGGAGDGKDAAKAGAKK